MGREGIGDAAVEAPVKLIHPDDVGYICHQFGDCCREKWSVPVTPEESARLDTLASSGQLADQLRGLPPTVEHDHECRTFSRRGCDCVFLGSDNLCSLHARFGADAKPDVCRLFPYLFTETPDGVVVGYSFVCHTVREGLSERTHAPEAELGDTLARARREARVHYRRIALPLGFHADHAVGWDGYLAVERMALHLLHEGQLPLPRRLVAIDVLASLLSEYFKRKGAKTPEEHDRIALDFARQMQADGYRLVMRLARLPLPSRLMYRVLSSLLLLLMPGREASRGGAMREWFALLWRKLPAAGKEADWSAEETAEVERYLAHVLLRKDLVCGGPLHARGGIRRGLVMLALMFSLIRHHRNQLSVDWTPREAVHEAILRVERGFGPHARFRPDGPASRSRTLQMFWNMADNVMGRKRFVPSMVLPT